MKSPFLEVYQRTISACTNYTNEHDCEGNYDSVSGDCEWTGSPASCAVPVAPEDDDGAFSVVSPIFLIVLAFILNLFL
jgi:hypothetical protein